MRGRLLAFQPVARVCGRSFAVGRYAAAQRRFLTAFLDLAGPQRNRDFVSEGQNRAAPLDLDFAAGSTMKQALPFCSNYN